MKEWENGTKRCFNNQFMSTQKSLTNKASTGVTVSFTVTKTTAHVIAPALCTRTTVDAAIQTPFSAALLAALGLHGHHGNPLTLSRGLLTKHRPLLFFSLLWLVLAQQP